MVFALFGEVVMYSFQNIEASVGVLLNMFLVGVVAHTQANQHIMATLLELWLAVCVGEKATRLPC